ncbi:transposase [Chitinophaga sp.]|uniref:transposase n=1 Tax=Chitinophaga sp. TaxID=1869181 RepID=UPI0031E240D0
MAKQKFTLQQIQSAIYQVRYENKTAKQVCRELGITEATFSNWKKLQEIKDLREEVARLKALPVTRGDLEYPDQEEMDLLKTVSDIIVDIILREDEKDKENMSEQKIQKRDGS